MMYNSRLVCAVKTGGKILREEQKEGNAIVTLPFGSEYSLLLKNLSGKRALVNIEIDGKKLASNGFILEAGKEYEIERPVNSNNKFKFIEKTEEISNYRGDRIDDSMIRLTWQFEQAQIEYTYYKYTWPPKIYPRVKITRKFPNPWRKNPWPWYKEEIIEEEEIIPWDGVYYTTDASGTSGINLLRSTSNISSNSNISCSNSTLTSSGPSVGASQPAKAFASGITVGGSESHQKFENARIGVLENEIHSMVIQLRGIAGERIVEKPVTVSTKTRCSSCGRYYKKNKFKFCPNDGTSLDS